MALAQVQHECGSGATADREILVEYNEERGIDNEYKEIVENKETMEYNEYNQTMRFCSETDEMT
eukprot:4070487-Amphidinium_carterae.1